MPRTLKQIDLTSKSEFVYNINQITIKRLQIRHSGDFNVFNLTSSDMWNLWRDISRNLCLHETEAAYTLKVCESAFAKSLTLGR